MITGEAGEVLEGHLFGEKLKCIVSIMAECILDMANWEGKSLEEFRDGFNRLAVTEEDKASGLVLKGGSGDCLYLGRIDSVAILRDYGSKLHLNVKPFNKQ